jgi:pyridoxamine 5'-phosphate oxidase family protein
MFTEAEYRYLTSHPLGRLASIGPDGAPQVHPVPFVVDKVSGCIEIEGPRLYETQKWRNVRRDPRVSLVVDDQAPGQVRADGRYGRGIEIRGAAELGHSADVIRVRPARIIVWNLDGPGRNSRFVT